MSLPDSLACIAAATLILLSSTCVVLIDPAQAAKTFALSEFNDGQTINVIRGDSIELALSDDRQAGRYRWTLREIPPFLSESKPLYLTGHAPVPPYMGGEKPPTYKLMPFVVAGAGSPGGSPDCEWLRIALFSPDDRPSLLSRFSVKVCVGERR